MKLKANTIANILTLTASVGTLATGVLSAWGTVKILELEGTEPKEKLQKGWQYYIPAIAAATVTIGCVASSRKVSAKQTSTAVASYAMARKLFKRYSEAVKEKAPDLHEEIMAELNAEVAKDVPITAECLGNVGDLEFYDSPEKKEIFYLPELDRYFESTPRKVLQAEYHLNRNYALRGDATLQELVIFLGLEPDDRADDLVWDMSYSEMYWIDFDHPTKKHNGKTIYRIDICNPPTDVKEVYPIEART